MARGVGPDELRAIVTALPEVRISEHGSWTTIGVRGKGFGWLAEDEESLILKAHRDEQEALVAQDPDTFEPSFTTGKFGWLRIRLAGVEREELVELATEAWCQTAPRSLVQEHASALSLPPEDPSHL
jgi:hypothetical protein